MTREELLDPFNRLLEERCSATAVRAIEAEGPAETLWNEIAASGYLDALVGEEAGGAGLALGDITPLLMALGRHAVPLPVGDTMIARALLSRHGITPPDGPIVIAAGSASAPLPLAATAGHALVEHDGALVLASLSQAERVPTGEPHMLARFLVRQDRPSGPALPAGSVDLAALSAILSAAAIAGAGDRLLEMTVAYANDRVQFGKPIGKQQALQQQLAVMAEQVVAARMAAEIGCAAGLDGNRTAAAVAKRIASAAAVVIADTAHAIHGAIGISEEHDLQLFTRRVRASRIAAGGESYWAEKLGRLRIQAAHLTTVDFIRERIAPSETAA